MDSYRKKMADKLKKSNASFKKLLTNTTLNPWVKDLKKDHPTAFRVCMLHLGPVVASSFQETVFSTSTRVWNKSTARLHPDNYEKRTILRHNRTWIEEGRRAFQKNKSCAAAKL